jgi:hypothetical protein
LICLNYRKRPVDVVLVDKGVGKHAAAQRRLEQAAFAE